MSAEAPRPTASNLKKIVRQATVPAVELLAETRSALLLVDVTNRFIVGSSLESPASTIRVLQPISALLEVARAKNELCGILGDEAIRRRWLPAL